MESPLLRTLIISASVLILLLAILDLGQAQGPPTNPTDNSLIDRLRRESAGPVRISYHAETGRVRFIGAAPDRAIKQPATLGPRVTPEQAGRGFLATYGRLFGLNNPNRELAVMKMRTLDDGRSFVRFQQLYRDIPVVGGELIIQSDTKHNIISANGEILPELDLDVTPTITAEAARQTALAKVAKAHGLNTDDLTTSEPELWIYNPILLGGPGPRFSSLVWRLEVTPVELAPIRELVLVDAKFGAVVLNFNQVHTAKNRVTHDANNSFTLPGTLVCNESNPTCSGGDSHEVAAHTYAGDTYDFYLAEHGRDSIDDAGMTMVSTVHYGFNVFNAFWNGSQMIYGDAAGFPLADDVVAHELTHGVTEYESGLNYFYQSGAINESLSDVWGEFVDLAQATGNDAGDTRWEVGEDISGFGALRNMQNPPAFGDPDRMLSSNYWCGEADNGGVHINSGVNNKAVFLMVDGGTFNGKTVTGMGISQVADLYYEVQTNLLTSGSNYNALYDALIQASINLGFNAADQQEVRDALDAVEMNQRPCNDSAQVPLCFFGSPDFLFFDDLEDIAIGNWGTAPIIGSTQWFWGDFYAHSGTHHLWGDNQSTLADYYVTMTFDVALPPNAYMHFMHDWAFEDDFSDPFSGVIDESDTLAWDGGVLEYSTNGGSSWNDAGSLFTNNGYNGPILNISGFTNNPLQGREAFTHEGHGYNASQLDLSSLAGQNVRFRFRIGTDSSLGAPGWFIDDVSIYTCEGGPANIYYFPIITKDQ